MSDKKLKIRVFFFLKIILCIKKLENSFMHVELICLIFSSYNQIFKTIIIFKLAMREYSRGFYF